MDPPTPDTSVVVVGDTHGQFHDVCHLLKINGNPSTDAVYVFNGDFVDRGAWGIETLLLLCCWKLARPSNFYMLRGNHETATCAIMYGFKGELMAKYGKKDWRPVFNACKRLFASLPLAARIGSSTLVLHGGLFRPSNSKKKRKHMIDENSVGSLETLAQATKGGLDPSWKGPSRLASDVLWSDPVKEESVFEENEARGIGLIFGPDTTENFLKSNNLKLILRSHEGPDARADRPEMGNMLNGWTEDHVTASGKLITVFSAPDYPQFLPEDTPRYKNKGAVAVLTHPDYCSPSMRQFEAQLPRPKAEPYYDLCVNDSDEEFEALPPTASGMTDVGEQQETEDDEEEIMQRKRLQTSESVETTIELSA